MHEQISVHPPIRGTLRSDNQGHQVESGNIHGVDITPNTLSIGIDSWDVDVDDVDLFVCLYLFIYFLFIIQDFHSVYSPGS